jgi:hypothetical protein
MTAKHQNGPPQARHSTRQRQNSQACHSPLAMPVHRTHAHQAVTCARAPPQSSRQVTPGPCSGPARHLTALAAAAGLRGQRHEARRPRAQIPAVQRRLRATEQLAEYPGALARP